MCGSQEPQFQKTRILHRERKIRNRAGGEGSAEMLEWTSGTRTRLESGCYRGQRQSSKEKEAWESTKKKDGQGRKLSKNCRENTLEA